MRKSVVFVLALVFILGTVGLAFAADNHDASRRKRDSSGFVKMIPKDR